MGMFDYARFDKAIQFPFQKLIDDHNHYDEFGNYWQTKDFDSTMDIIVICRDGTILRERAIHEEVPEEERPTYGTPEWDTPFGKMIGSVRTKETVVDTIGLADTDTFHIYHHIERYSYKERQELGMERGGPTWWIDVWADVKDHKIHQLRYKVTYRTAYDEDLQKCMETIENEGIIYVNSEGQSL